jgi:hypothetical protein
VSSGTTTVALQARVYTGSAYVYLGRSSLMTLFVPFGNAGSQGTLSPDQPSSSEDADEATPPAPPVPAR